MDDHNPTCPQESAPARVRRYLTRKTRRGIIALTLTVSRWYCRLRHGRGDNHSLVGGRGQQLPGRPFLRRRRFERSVWTGRRRIIRDRQWRIGVEVHRFDRSGSEGDR